ncbi:AraC family transcriptional regulator [Pseudophaeobacter sp.]|uniref:AraC family transcriptional regulator n=1 Tax=Pseudophaeobacter sp. TaxID=1971739 RepID=UPI003296ABEB
MTGLWGKSSSRLARKMRSSDAHIPDPAKVAHPLGDPLGEILHLLKLTGTFYCQSDLTAPWGIDIPPLQGAMAILVVTEGQCWLELAGEEPLAVGAGDLILLTCGPKHRLLSTPGGSSVELAQLPVHQVSEAYETLQFGGGGALTRAMYGIVRFDHAAGQRLVSLLPKPLHVASWGAQFSDWLQSTLRFIACEARALRPGGETMITRLADIIVIETIRNWISSAPEAQAGWLLGLRDAQIGRAIREMHRTPAQDWTVADLAGVAGMSRSAFSARFTALMGQPAMQYLTGWRMQLARAQLLDGGQSLAAIAQGLGYQSEPAFSRAFKRVYGLPPGRLRQQRGAGKNPQNPDPSAAQLGPG